MESAMRLDCPYNSLSFTDITQFSRLTASEVHVMAIDRDVISLQC